MFTMNAREYNEKTMKGLFRKIYPVIARQVLEHTGVRRGHCIDLGGGPGMLGICVAQASELAVTIVDPLADCVALAHGNIAEHGLGERVAARQGQAEQLEFADASVDLVVSRGSIYFWQDQGAGLREIFRVLRPGGWAWIGGGFGNRALRDEILALKADDPDWNRARQERGNRHPPEHFAALLAQIGIDGEIRNGDEGMWIVFCKPEVQQ
jgi:ubiquinone/menaquinone biosynthesis C-methylase UbiE